MINASLNISVTRKSLELASLAGCRLGLVTDIVMGAGPGETCSPRPLLVLLSACKKKKKSMHFPKDQNQKDSSLTCFHALNYISAWDNKAFGNESHVRIA